MQLFETDLGGKVVTSWDHASELDKCWHSIKLTES